MSVMKLMYNSPAKRWEDVLPLGNGSLGAMVWGNTSEEIIGLNHDQIWSGYPRDKNNPSAKNHLEEVRKAILEEDYAKADEIAEKHMLGEYGESYLPLGNIRIKTTPLTNIKNYQRELNLEKAIATVCFESENKKYTREYFTSYPQKALYIRYTGASQDYHLMFDSVIEHSIKSDTQGIEIYGQCPEHTDPDYIRRRSENFIQGTKGFKFSGEIHVVQTDGVIQTDNEGIRIIGATEFILEVRFVDKFPAKDFNFSNIKKEHIRDYENLYRRVDISFGEQSNLPTNEQMDKLKEGEIIPSLFALYFQFGRYLLISSSREGTLPPNLQGIWAWQYPTAWSSNWTTNMNIQMNYWPAESTNLKECLFPYFDWIDKVVQEGKKTAKIHYGARGSVVHHNVDRWYNTNPVGIEYGNTIGQEGCASYAMWTMALPWICQELFKYYEYQQDKQFLNDRVYPILKECVLFITDWLQEINGEYISYPSTSPENRFSVDGKTTHALTKNTAYDLQVIKEVTANFNKTCEILNIKDPLLEELNKKVSMLTPIKIGSKGQILEWDKEFIELELDHRHFSHLYGLFPGESFDNQPELIEAAKVSLDIRTSVENPSPRTGWSNAWLINYYAILQDKKQTGQYLKQLLIDTSLDNLWGMHPPFSAGGDYVFQVDANFGGTAGIANMLVNERNNQLNLLPGLPEFIPTGYVKGLRLKNNQSIDISWANGQLIDYELYPAN